MKDTTKLNLRLPAAVRDEATIWAQAQGLSLNAYLLRAVMNANAYWGPKLVKQAQQATAVATALRATTAPPPAPATGQPMNAPSSAAPAVPKVGPNAPCPCGSGQKYKRCHGKPAAA